MKKKIISILLITLFIGAFIVSNMITYATKTTTPLYVVLSKTALNKDRVEVGYTSGNPNGGTTNQTKYIWNINTLEPDGTTLSNIQKNLYCVKADYGQTWYDEEDVDANVAYELYYDMQLERNIIDSDNFEDSSGVVQALLTPEGGQYEQLLWIFDNAYIEGEDIEQYLENIGVNGDAQQLTETDIIAIQKMAIWYFTNTNWQDSTDPANNTNPYNKIGKDYWLYVKEGEQDYTQLNDLNEERNSMANELYNKLIAKAKLGASQYTAANNYQITTTPANVDVTGLATENDKCVLEATRDGGYYFVGPITIKENNDLEYDIEIVVKDQDNKKLTEGTDYVYTSSDKTTELDITELSEETNGFYIRVPSNSIESIDIEINLPYTTTEKVLWLSGDETTNGITLDGEQPLVEIIRKTNDNKITLTSKPEEFDLALRKYITAVNGETLTGTNSRVPVIDYGPLANVGTTETTAHYNHRKDPVQVKVGDEVTYRITIYNEGNKAGYATRIVDQLPEGLIRKSNNDAQPIISIDKDGNERNKYSLASSTTIASTNQIILTIIDTDEQPAQELQPYTGTGEPDYETIEIKCTVTQEPDMVNDIILTNVAWIDEAFDSDSNKTITTTVGEDRDSEPGTKPNVSKSNIEDFRGNTNNTADLAENTYHYGEQDDDDFEKLILKAEPKIFDLALFKHIAAVSKDQTFGPGEFITDTGNIDGKYLRAPEATGYDETTGEIIYEYETDGYSKQSKEPLSVEPGDYVLYTIRVYNEGELDGYASEIKDRLPKGLNFVESNEEYNGDWILDRELLLNEDIQEVTTTKFAKDDNETYLLKAFNTEGEINDENPDYIDAQVLCQVANDAESNVELINYAQITEDTDKNGEPIDDNDSDTEQWKDGDDDQDIEKVVVQRFDLSLRKFIISVNGQQKSREPQVNVQPLKDGEETAIYTHSKIPVAVQPGDTVIYTIRVYNEGDIDGYASEVKDYLPPYLKYVKDSEINKKYGWSISEDGRVATTTYLANTELKAFDLENGTQLDSADLQIECTVSEGVPVNVNQTNIAEISEYKYNENIVSSDRDSTSDNMTDKNTNYMPSDSELPTYMNEYINNSYVEGNEDDDDFEKVYVKELDLALRKFITSVNGQQKSREPQVNIQPLKDGEETAIYTHSKIPVAVQPGDTVIYTIRVYNEGDIDGYASEVKDYLPPYLKYVKDSEINKKYGWSISEDGRVATTTYLANKKLKAFDLENGTQLDSADLQIECTVSEGVPVNVNQTNIAEISEYKYNENIISSDRDSTSDNMTDKNTNYMPSDSELPTYMNEYINNSYVEGNEDDDDFEKVYVKEFDLALRKFITKVQETEISTRIPQPKIENGTITYEHTKEPLIVHVGDTIIYTLRIYNEGEIDGYASEITDDIPEYLEYLPEDSTNVEYMWKMYDENGAETENVEEAVKVKTEYLSKENGENNLLKAYDGETLSYKDIKIAFKVKDPNSNTYIITNHAQISDDTDANGKEVEDNDSTPDEWIDNENHKDDDQDIENVKVEYFDLSLLKFVSKVIVIEEGKETITETGYNGHENPEPVVKVDLHKKKLSDVIVKFGYGITITNEGDIPGYAKEITDYVPEGLKFESADNPQWTDEGNNIISTKQLENTLLQPGESKTIEVIFTWINGKDNMGQKTNTAEISEDKNEFDVPDRDSTPDNKKEGEDDIDIAKVILAVTTGKAKTYFTFTLSLLAVMSIGIALIKKFVI